MADGSIIIDTRIDDDGIEEGVTKLKSEIKKVESEVSALTSKMEDLAKVETPTDDYKWLNGEISKANEELNKLIARQDKMTATGVKEDSQAWKNLQYDMQLAKQKLAEYLGEKSRLESTGKAYVSGTTTAEYKQLSTDLSAANARLQTLNSSLSSATNLTSRLGTGAKKYLDNISSAAKTIAGKMLSALKSAASSISYMLKNTRAMKSPFDSLAGTVKRFAPALLAAEGVVGIFRKAVNAYMQENQQLSAQLSTMWSRLGSVLGPIITKLINLLASAVSYVQQFFQMLGVVGTEASNQIDNAGNSASKETKKLQKQLASFDQLNVLGSKETSNSGGSGTQAAAGSLPEVALPDWVQLMVDKLKSGNWAEAAQTMTQQLNGMISSVDWAGIGTKIATYLDGALTFLATSILTFDWFALGADLATSINSILNGVDWTNLGTVLGAKFIVLIEGLGGLFATLDWSALGNALGNSLMGLWNSIDWAQTGKTISDGVKGAFNAIGSTIKTINWKEFGKNVAKNVAKFIGNIDWSGMTSSLFDGIGAALGGIAAFIWGIVEEAWGSVVDWWYEVAYEDGEFTIEGLLKGIWEAVKGIGKWIKTNIFDPFIKGFKEAFGIHSPSTVMKEQGNFIIQGLINGIKAAWKSITSFFGTALSGIKTTIQNTWNSIKNSKTWQTISTNLKATWTNLRANVNTKFNGIRDKILSAWNAVKNSKTWNTITSNLSSKWSEIRTKATSAFSGMKTSVVNVFNALKSALRTPINGIIGFINKMISGIVSGINTAIRALNRIKISVPNWVPSIGGKYFGFNLSTITAPRIPYLAKGAVIPPRAPFIATLGDQKHGTNIEAPLETIQEAVALVMEDMVGGMMAGFESTVAVLREILEAILGIEIGDEIIANAVKNYNRKMAIVKGG